MVARSSRSLWGVSLGVSGFHLNRVHVVVRSLFLGIYRFPRVPSTLITEHVTALFQDPQWIFNKILCKIQAPKKEGIDTLTTNSNQSFFHIADKLIEMESNLIHEKRMVGLELSRERGIKGGRPKVIDRKTFLLALKMYKARKINVGKICEKFNINRRSFYRYLEDNERQSKLLYAWCSRNDRFSGNIVRTPIWKGPGLVINGG